jgi:hypothetical protein
MLEFAENVIFAIRRLENETKDFVSSGNVKSMEQYKHLMGRLEGYAFVQEAIQDVLSKNSDQ